MQVEKELASIKDPHTMSTEHPRESYTPPTYMKPEKVFFFKRAVVYEEAPFESRIKARALTGALAPGHGRHPGLLDMTG